MGPLQRYKSYVLLIEQFQLDKNSIFCIFIYESFKIQNHILRHITRSIKVNGVSSVIERQSCLVPVRDTRQHHFGGRSFKLCRSGVNSICGLRAPFIIYSN